VQETGFEQTHQLFDQTIQNDISFDHVANRESENLQGNFR
jgi:hypothetical protein